VPRDQATLPLRMSAVPPGLARKSAPVIITNVPIVPSPIANHALRFGYFSSRPDHTAITSGMKLMSATAAPELTVFSATVTLE